MRSIEITNLKEFTSKLFAGTEFDDYLAPEIQISTAATFTIDGHLNEGFVGGDEMQLPENREGIVAWKKLRPVCYEIIKGKKVPQQFKIVFKMPAGFAEDFIRESGCLIGAESISGLYLNVHFKNGQLYCTTGISRSSFTMDKKLDVLWDDYMEEKLKIYR